MPLRLRDTTIGALNLFRLDRGTMGQPDIDAAQALADAATITILQHRAVIETSIVNGQLQLALTSRVLIEQAKGVLTERSGVEMDQAFAALRSYARSHNRRLADVAVAVIDGTLDVSGL